jgi:hypothetical protein
MAIAIGDERSIWQSNNGCRVATTDTADANDKRNSAVDHAGISIGCDSG